MSDFIRKEMSFADDIDYDAILELSRDDAQPLTAVRDASLVGTATRAGVQTNSLQSAMDGYARALDRSAIAKSTGMPVRTPTQQYKGFAAEEYYKQTLKINALAKGIPDRKIGVYTKGEMPDGSVLSGTDMKTDISVWTRKHIWSKPRRTVDYQAKMHNNAADYAKDMSNPQYQDVEFVGGAGQGVNDTVKVTVDGKTVSSDAITPGEAAELADSMKAQSVPEYGKRQEKLDELNRVNLGRAIAAGAATGLIVTTVQEIIGVIRNARELPEDQFIKSVEHILCGTAEGGVRGGAIAGSVQLFGKMLGREVASNSLEAIPVMAATNVAVDFAKDLYRCFVAQTIDTDDLLCNSVNNAFTSAAGFGGGWFAGQLGGQIAGQLGGQAFAQGVSLAASAKTAAATGAAIGSSLGPIGTVIGSVVGGLLIGIGANAIIETANRDAQKAYCKCIDEINAQIELSGCEKVYYFADTMESLSEFRLSFKDLLPCYNLISDLKEYNLHKKAMKAIGDQLESRAADMEAEKRRALQALEEQHQKRMKELREMFAEQREAMEGEFRESINTYVAGSYMQYIGVSGVLTENADSLLEELEQRKTAHSAILDYMRHRNAVNTELNDMLHDLMEDKNSQSLLRPFVEKLTWFMQQDEMMIGRQYVSFEEAMLLISGGNAS